jgi:hypothetical protein
LCGKELTMRLFSELKRRNVIRMGGLYVVGAWLIVQVAETLLPLYDTPAWVLKSLVLLLAIGFVPTLVFSWIFELTPDGIKRDSDVDRSQGSTDRTARGRDHSAAGRYRDVLRATRQITSAFDRSAASGDRN